MFKMGSIKIEGVESYSNLKNRRGKQADIKAGQCYIIDAIVKS